VAFSKRNGETKLFKSAIEHTLIQKQMKNYLGRIVLLVKDYDEATNFYETNFGFKKMFDTTTDVRSTLSAYWNRSVRLNGHLVF